jgi:hypothetical protein
MSRAGAISARSAASLRSTSTTSWLSRSTRRPSRRRTPFLNFWARSKRSCGAGESLSGEPSETPSHLIGSGEEKRAQLVEGGGASLHGASTLEEKEAQILAPATTASKAEPRA